MTRSTIDLRDAFIAGELDPESFSHRDHVAVGYELLRGHGFLEAATLCADGIRELAAAGGAPRKFNLTITLAFLSLIAERMTGTRTENRAGSFEAFLEANPDLASAEVLRSLYSSGRLGSEAARQTFLLPDLPAAPPSPA